MALVSGIERWWRRDPASRRPENGPLRALAAVLAVGIAFLVARCGASSASKPQAATQSEAEVRAAVAKTVAVRAAAVLHHDKAAYLATDAAGAWRTNDAARFDSLMVVPLSAWTLKIDDKATKMAHLYQVDQSYEISGVDPQPVASTEYLSFVPQGSDWVVSSDSDGAAVGLRSDVQIWDQGPISVVHGSRSLVIGLGGEARLKPYADLADHGAAKAAKIWGAAGWHGTVLVEVPMAQAQVETLLNEKAGDLQGVAGVTAGEGGKPTGSAPASRVLVNPDAWATLALDSWQVVMDHELTHVATRLWNTASTPIWLSEGAADYSGYQDSGIPLTRVLRDTKTAAAQPGFDAGVLPTGADFTGDHASIAYQESNLACRLIAEKYGQAKLVAFYKAVGTAASGTVDPVDQAFRSVLGTTTKDFTAKWKQYVLTKARS
jgi:hypothetical protein